MTTRIQLRRDTAANWASTNPTLTQGEPGYETDTGKIKYGDGTTAWNSLAYQAAANIVDGTIVDADINASAEIAVSKLADGAARQLIQTDAAGTGVEWTSNVDVPGTLDVTSTATFDSIAQHPLGSAAAPTLTFTGDNNTGIYSPGADQLALSTNGTGRLIINPEGSVAIGVASPSTKLHVSGGVWATSGELAGGNTASTGTDGTFRLLSSGGTNFFQFGQNRSTGSAAPLVFGSIFGGAEYMRITSTGLVGIGTSSVDRLFIASDSADNNLPCAVITKTVTGGANSGLQVHTAGTDAGAGAYCFRVTAGNTYSSPTSEYLRVTAAGHVGIGTTSPNNKLEVVGAGYFTDWVYTGSSSGSRGISSDSSTRALLFGVNGSEVGRFDTSGRLLVGTSSARSDFFNANTITPVFQVQGTGNNRIVSITAVDTSSQSGAGLILAKSRSTGNTIVQSGDYLGEISFQGSDGVELVEGAAIEAVVDGTPGSNDLPTRLMFSTTADGASSPTERMRIAQTGNISFSNTGFVFPNTDNGTSIGGATNRWTAVWAVNGTIQTSDGREKTEVHDASLGTDFIKSLRPVSYKWIEGGKRDTGERDEGSNYIYESVPGERTHWGFIAQEVKQVVDAAGVDFGGWVLTDKDDPDSQQALRYDQFIAPLTKALQETMAELEVLKAEVAALKAQ